MLTCNWHTLKCFAEQLRCKLADKTRYREAFDALYGIMYLKHNGTEAEQMAAVDASIASFKEAFSDEPTVVQYFEQEWEPKKGADPCTGGHHAGADNFAHCCTAGKRCEPARDVARTCEHCAEMWVAALRSGVNHRDDDTTAICEGFHSVVKSLLRSSGGEALRVDKLIHFLLDFVDEMFAFREVRRRHGALQRRRVRAAARPSI